MKRQTYKLKRPDVYVRILRLMRLKPAQKSNVKQAYMTTDHLRKIYEELTNCDNKSRFITRI